MSYLYCATLAYLALHSREIAVAIVGWHLGLGLAARIQKTR